MNMKKLKLFTFSCLFIFNIWAQDGTPDSTFGSYGYVITDFNTSFSFQEGITSSVIQADGKIVVVGSQRNNDANSSNILIARYKTNGTLDSSFDSDGYVITSFSTGNSEANEVSVQPDGKIVVSGRLTYVPADANNPFCSVFLRYNSDGSIDSSFATNGVFYYDSPNYFWFSLTHVSSNDGGIIFSFGYAEMFGINSYVKVVKLTNTGVYDNSFGTNGVDSLALVSGQVISIYDIILQADNKIVLGGSYVPDVVDYSENFFVCRYNQNGTLDSGFGNGGIVASSLSNRPHHIVSLDISPDGKIIAGGTELYNWDDVSGYYAVARYNSDGSLDSTFNLDGYVTTLVNATDDVAYAKTVKVQEDSKILLAGSRFLVDEHYMDIIRYNYDGSLDYTFGNNGNLIQALEIFHSGQHDAINLQTDNKIILVGRVYDSNYAYDFAIARFNNNESSSPQVGIFENNLSNVKVVPNPSNGRFEINFGQNLSHIEMRLVDLKGKEVLKKESDFGKSIEINESLLKGFYFIHLNANEGNFYQKIIIQ